jgi:hypothetical protein
VGFSPSVLMRHAPPVIILDEQMRQADDVIFQNLLARARAGALTEHDLALLNAPVGRPEIRHLFSLLFSSCFDGS